MRGYDNGNNKCRFPDQGLGVIRGSEGESSNFLESCPTSWHVTMKAKSTRGTVIRKREEQNMDGIGHRMGGRHA